LHGTPWRDGDLPGRAPGISNRHESRRSGDCCFYATDIHSATLGKGKSDDSLKRTSEIKGELLHIWGRQDPHVPLEGRNLIKDRLEQTGADYTWHEFNAAHAFMRDEGNRYDPALAHICWGLVFELFHRRLRG
jgi:carboxymethylenebutenolidase